jgi:hypothetical protein
LCSSVLPAPLDAGIIQWPQAMRPTSSAYCKFNRFRLGAEGLQSSVCHRRSFGLAGPLVRRVEPGLQYCGALRLCHPPLPLLLEPGALS